MLIHRGLVQHQVNQKESQSPSTQINPREHHGAFQERNTSQLSLGVNLQPELQHGTRDGDCCYCPLTPDQHW